MREEYSWLEHEVRDSIVVANEKERKDGRWYEEKIGETGEAGEGRETREKPATRCCISGISISISYSSSNGGTSSSSGSNGIIVSNVRFQTNIRRFEKDKLLRT
uniref:Uncharacterized protein n=1 Tax=Vespula pensylvanica TaxID=30213 RepID=A0A834UFU2_VESPE|nr:hypothetical protein H0235_000442 [Vespula pensylvanica]